MLLYEKELSRKLEDKTHELLHDLEEKAHCLLRQLSGVDKVTLTKLREIMDDYYSAESKISACVQQSFHEMEGAKNELNREFQRVHNASETEVTKAIAAFIEALAKIRENFEREIINHTENYIMEDYTRDVINRIAEESQPYDVVHTTGFNLTQVMSQKAVSENLMMLSNDIGQIASVSGNLFDKESTINGGYFDGNNGEVVDDELSCRLMIPITAGYYSFMGDYSIYGIKVAHIPLFNVYGEYVKTIQGEVVETLAYGRAVRYEVTSDDVADGVTFAGYSLRHSKIDVAMYVRGAEYPDKYTPYGDVQITSKTKESIKNALPSIMPEITPEYTSFAAHIHTANLFDKSKAIAGGYYNVNNGQIVEYDYGYTCLIPLKKGSYTFAGSTGIYGINVHKVPLFDGEGKYIKTIEGTSGEVVGNATLVTFTISDLDIDDGVAFAGYSLNHATIEYAMFVSGTKYPSVYIGYGEYIKIPQLKDNVLVGKTVAFDGDSICNGASANDGLSGWAGRIGNANHMVWKNYAIGGGTITAEIYGSNGNPRHWISSNIEHIREEIPELDYLILEGGTNDADLLNEAEQMGVFDLGDFSGSYDNTTFCGALETLFYKAVTYYPRAKIGYIVAQRMGYTQYTSNYDTTGSKRYRYFVKAMEICKKWAIPYLNLWDASHMNPKISSMYNHSLDNEGNITGGYLYTDGQHLTPAGYNHITPIIEAWMKTL